jgi:proteasome lid subunit RPN8/RPN11
VSELKEYFKPQKNTAFASLPFITRPARDESFSIFTSEHDSFAAFIHQNVRDAIFKEAYKAAPNETIGLLAGRVMRDEGGLYTLVLAAQGARHDEVEATPSHVRISASGYAQVRSRLESSAYGLDVIGWYHSHPRYPARFSPVDITEQSTWRDQNHLGIVISGNDNREPLGVYRGPHAALLTPVRSEIPPPKKIAQPDITFISPRVEENKEEAIAAIKFIAPAVAVRTPRPRSEGVLRYLPLALGLGLLGMAISLIRLDYRIAGVEKKMALVEIDKERVSSAPPETTTSPLPSNSPAERVPLKETTVNDNLILGDNPVTKTHPLLPAPATTPTRRVKSGRNLKTSGKDAARVKSAYGNNRPRPAKKATISQTETVKPESALANKLKSNSESAAGKSVKP